MQTSEAPPRVITLHQNGQHMSINDDDLCLLGDLRGRQLVATDDPQHGYYVQPTWQSLMRTQDGYRKPNAGCIPVLQRRASDRNIDLRVCQSPPISQLPESSLIAHLAYHQLARFVCNHERGMIRIPSWVAAEDVIYDLALAYPDQRIVVLGDHVRQSKRIYKELAPKIASIQCVTAQTPLAVDDDDEMPQVIISTFMQAVEVDFATCDIVLLLDAYHCDQDRVQLALSQVDARFRLFGLVTVGRTVAPSQEDSVMAVFGPEVLDLFGYRRSRRDVNVVWVDNYHSIVSLSNKDCNFWRRCYWHNGRRNRRIRQLASALASGTPLGYRQFGEVAKWFDGRDCKPQIVTILVDRPRHAVELSKLLPDWRVVTGDVPLDGCPSSFRKRVKRQKEEWNTSTKQIVLAGATRQFRADSSDVVLAGATRQFRADSSDVVIWAGGGPHTDAIPRSWFSTAGTSNKPLLIVDLLDQHNRTARRWSRDRQAGYCQRDVFPLGTSPTQGRITMFLDR